MLSQYAFSVSTIMSNAYLQISGNINFFMQFCINVTILKVSCLEMAIVPSNMPSSQERTKGNTKSLRNRLRSTSHRSQQRSVLVLWTSVVTVTMVVLLITGILVYIKKRNLIKRAGDENQQEDNNVMITT